MKKHLLLFFVSFVLLNSFIACKPKASLKEVIEEPTVQDNGSVTFGNTNCFQLTKDMGLGWNLGNTLDATNGSGLASETSWGQPLTTKTMIDGLAASGIKTIRIPVSWHNHITDVTTLTISPEWMNRVKTVVDWAIEDGMYVILNTHHDNYGSPVKMPAGSGYYPNNVNLTESLRFIERVWTQIAQAFNNGYDEHLIFEALNEPRPAGTTSEWWFSLEDSISLEARDCLNQMNQKAVDTIRASGGNNTRRFIMVPALAASENAATSPGFKMPKDIQGNAGRIILSLHAYSPYSFAMESPGERTFTAAHKAELNAIFEKLKTSFIDKGYTIVIGEYGATNKDNLSDRVAWFDYYIKTAKQYGIPCVLWDNGNIQPTLNDDSTYDFSECFGYYNRTGQYWYFPDILNAMVNAVK